MGENEEILTEMPVYSVGAGGRRENDERGGGKLACIEFVYGEKQGPRERERPQGVREKGWFATGGFCAGG